ncbi:sugar ABC transporter permease [Ruminococcus sp.]|uniref:sugar ABC transporter permease n=1 Tax=Ruminococcus sp. TaxID=41978 RepID=UPI0025DBB005|nr:sugar ABC transporter permease [Ruminococcus sp.]MBQ8966696.1 sugar ABC transporter permease [Ruminococcus sp.]
MSDNNSNKKYASKSGKERTARTLIYIFLTALSIIWLLPFIYLICQAFRGESRSMVTYVFPKKWSLENFRILFKETQFLHWYLNTLIIALFNAVLQTVIVLSVAYALSRMRFKGRKLIMNLMLVLGMFPGFLSMIATYFILKLIGLTSENAVPGLILVYAASSGMGYYIAKGFFDTIPKSLDEAARIDGASRSRVFFRIIMPMAKPIIIYTIMMAFIAPWGDFMYASLITFGHEKAYNVAVGLYRWLDKEHINNYFTVFCAGGLFVSVPVTALFMSLQRYYVEGVTGGAVKG